MILKKSNFNPAMFSGCEMWLDSSDRSSLANYMGRQFNNNYAYSTVVSGSNLGTQYSMAVWFTPYMSGTNQCIAALRDSSNLAVQMRAMIASNGKVEARIQDTSTTNAATSTSTPSIQLNSANLFIATRNGDSVTSYLNGTNNLVATNPVSPPIGLIDGTVLMFGAQTTTTNNFSGVIHSVAIWSGELSLGNKNLYYNSGIPYTFSQLTGTFSSDLFSYHSCGEPSGVIIDRTGRYDINTLPSSNSPVGAITNIKNDIYNGSAITRWIDKSGRSRLAKQVNSGVFAPVYNGCADFSKGFSYLDLDNQFTHVFSGAARNMSVFICYDNLNSSTTTESTIMSFSEASPHPISGDQFWFLSNNGGNRKSAVFRDYISSNTDYATSLNMGSLPLYNTANIYCATLNGNNLSCISNASGEVSAISSTNIAPMSIGAIGCRRRGAVPIVNSPAQAKIREVVVYSTPLNQVTINQVNKYMMDKWSITPTQITDLTLWVDASDTSTVTMASGSVVSIASKGGRNVVFSRAEAGLPTMRGNSIAFAQTPFSGAFAAPSGDWSAFVVWNCDGLTSSNQVVAGQISTSRYYLGGVLNSFNQIIWGRGSEFQTNYPIQFNTNYLNSFFVSGSTRAHMYTNGEMTLYNSGFVGTPGGTNSFYLGGGGFTSLGSAYSGLFSECIIYNKALTNEERRSIEYYLSRKWGINIV